MPNGSAKPAAAELLRLAIEFAGLSVTGTTAGSVSLSWTASTDDTAVTGYEVYRGTSLAGTAAGTSFTDTGLTAATSLGCNGAPAAGRSTSFGLQGTWSGSNAAPVLTCTAA